MNVYKYKLNPPSLEEIAAVIRSALEQNYEDSSVSIKQCPDLRHAPFHLAAPGLSGNECIADIGGQPNLFPTPVLSARYSLMSLADQMQLHGDSGMLIGAGAGPFFDVGVNSELAPNISWKCDAGSQSVTNLTRYTRVVDGGKTSCQISPTTNCALMMNLYGSEGLEGPVLRIKARKNVGGRSLTDCIRLGLGDHFGRQRPISLGGAFVIKKGTGKYHVMPDFPPTAQLPFKNSKQLNDWLTWHEFAAPMVCLTVMHTGDPGEREGKKLGLRMEHTHCFATDRDDRGGHYHTDVKSDEYGEVEYEGYFNIAKILYRIDQPQVVLERDLHD